MKEEYKSRVYTERPAYADFAPPEKLLAIESIVARKLYEHPNAICSYSGGADSDILVAILKAVDDLELIRPYEPNVVKAAWNIFGDSYRYRKKYNEYKAQRLRCEKAGGQLSFEEANTK